MQILVQYGKKFILNDKLFSKDNKVLQDYFFKLIFFVITFLLINHKARIYMEMAERPARANKVYVKIFVGKTTV
jgi:hypothetical protein